METTQEEKPHEAQVVSITKAQPQAQVTRWTPPTWDEERIALAKKAVTPPSASQAEFEFYIQWCRRTGLDPFIKQAYLVERRAKAPNGEWVTKHEPMAAEAGMGARADAESDFGGVKCAAVYAGDVFEVDEDAQTITHKWNLGERAKAGNKVLGAWAHAVRTGRVVPIVWLPLESRIQTRFDRQKNSEVVTSFWGKDPAGMIQKCARALAYRLAYPNIFSGVFIREEVQDEEAGAEAEIVPPAALVSRTTEVAAKVLAKVQQQAPKASPPKSLPQPTPTPTPPPTVASPPMPEDHVVQRGKNKGKPVSGLDAQELAESIEEHTAGLAKCKTAETRAQVATWLGELKSEHEKRMAELTEAAR